MSSVKTNRFQVDMINGPIVRSLVTFAIPILISYLFQQLYNAVDTMIVGHYLGDSSLAAIGACASIFELFVGFSQGFGNGMGIVAARCFGSGDEAKVRRCVVGCFAIGILLTIFLMILSLVTLMPLLVILGTPAGIIDECYSYISVIAICVGVMFAYNMLSALLRAIGNSVMPLVFLIFSSLLNVGLDLIFITRLNMGLRGAAVATVIAQAVSAILCLIYILLKCPLLIPKKPDFVFDAPLYKDMAGQGLSMGLMSGIVSSGSIILQSGINSIGEVSIAAYSSARRIYFVALVPFIGCSFAASTFVSQNCGAGKLKRVRQGVRAANTIGIVWGLFCILLMWAFGAPLMKFISGSDNEQLLREGALYLRLSAPFYAVLSVLLNTRNSLQGLGMKIVPLISSFIEFFGKVLFTIFLIPVFHFYGVIFCEPIIWCFMTIQLLFSYYRNPRIRAGKE